MRLVCCLSWWREDPQWLCECVASLPKAGVTHLVAVDGAYALTAGAKRRSSQREHEALREAAGEADIDLQVHTPARVWESEVAKRNFMFRKAERITEPSDWYFVLDGDTRILTDHDLRPELSKTDCDVAQVIVEEPHPLQETTHTPRRLLFRAIRGLRVFGNHWTYVAPDGRELWGGNELALAHRITDARIEHRTHFRTSERHALARGYYDSRDRARQEFDPCHICGRESVARVPTDWQVHPGGAYGKQGIRLSSTWVYSCAVHLERFEREKRQAWQRFDIDPRDAVCTYQHV